MKIVVCLKRVPDTASRIKVAGDGTSIDQSGLKYIVSPYDEFAVEAALRLKEATGDSEVIALCYGEAAAAEQLRSALAMGADGAVLLEGEPTMDGLATARVLAGELESMDADLILFGMKSADQDQQQVGLMTAGIMDLPAVSVVAEIEVEDDVVVCHREVEGGTEVVEAPLPAVVTITKGAHEPRYASLKGIMAAKRKPLEQKSVEEQESRIAVRALEPPPERPEGRIVGEGAEAVSELMRLLREEASAL